MGGRREKQWEKGAIDVITYKKQEEQVKINIYEVKSAIYDVQETIRQIKNYRNFIAGKNDPLFGQMKKKIIETFLVVPDNDREKTLINSHFSTFLKSGIDYVYFVDQTKKDLTQYHLKKMNK